MKNSSPIVINHVLLLLLAGATVFKKA